MYTKCTIGRTEPNPIINSVHRSSVLHLAQIAGIVILSLHLFVWWFFFFLVSYTIEKFQWCLKLEICSLESGRIFKKRKIF